MFGRMMNSFYYGKSGKGDFKKEDLPTNRWQLFWDMLRVRFSGLCRLNLMTVLAFLPVGIVIARCILAILSGLNGMASYMSLLEENPELLTMSEEALVELGTTLEQVQFYSTLSISDLINSFIFQTCLLLIPCVLITGPVQAGLAYVTRNWARDEHAFMWADFKDAVKENWKQALGVSALTSIVPTIVYLGWYFYGQMADTQGAFFMVPKVLIVSIGIVWALGAVFMYPMMVSYRMKFKEVIKNSILLAIARLPQTVGIRLVMLVLALVAGALVVTTTIGMYALLVLAAYYLIMGFALTRFVFASFTNAVFDKYINAHIEGAKVNRGLAEEEEDDEDDEEDNPEETEGKQE